MKFFHLIFNVFFLILLGFLPIDSFSCDPPVLVGVPADTTVNCEDLPLLIPNVIAEDNFSYIEVLKGNVIQKMQQMSSNRNWGMSTDLNKAFNAMLSMAIQNAVPAEDMPKILLILSDMQFNSCVLYDDSALEMIKRKYTQAGYEVPNVVFWNLSAHDNTPVKFDESGAALVSGFSPAIMKSVLSADLSNFTPEAIMLEAIMNERYDV